MGLASPPMRFSGLAATSPALGKKTHQAAVSESMRDCPWRKQPKCWRPTRSSPVHFWKSPPLCGAAFVVTTSNRLRRFNWLIVLGQAIAARGKHQPRRLLPNSLSNGSRGACQTAIGRCRSMWRRLPKVRLHGESISDCIIRVVIITLRQRGLL